MITFQNRGLVDLDAVTTFGISAKDTENPIGYFGTGLKYAIAIITREGGLVTLWRGTDKYEFTAKEHEVRGKDFKIIYMNDQKLGFTTELGKDWEPWQAFREIYCNTIDEDGSTTNAENVMPQEDFTTLVVEGCGEFQEAFVKRNSIVLPKDLEPIYAGNGIDVHSGKSNHIYYRGIVAYELSNASEFTYNIWSPLHLTEDRTLKYVHQFYAFYCDMIRSCSDAKFLEETIRMPELSFEGGFDLNQWGDERPSKTFMEVVGALAEDPEQLLRINQKAAVLYRKYSRTGIKPKEIELNQVEKIQYNRSVKFIKDFFEMDVEKYPIIPVETLGEHCMGLADRSAMAIVISRKAFRMGTKQVAGTLLEEFLHLDYHLHDESRDMQNFLLDRLISTVEVLGLKEPL